MDTISAMRVFAAVARQKSFTGGAKEVGVSTKVASNQIRQLEEQLGVQLLNRTTRRVTLTDTGRAYFERCVPLLEQFDEVESLVQEKQSVLAGPIRITAPTAFGSRELVDALAPFQIAHPRVSIDLHLADYRTNIVEEGFDLAIRFGVLEDSTLMARKLLDMRVVTYAAPEYLERHGEPAHPAELSTHNCLIQQSSADAENWKYREHDAEFSVRVHGGFRANSPRAIAHMVAAGQGIGRTPLYLAQPFVDVRSVKLLFEEYETNGFTLYAIYPQTRHLVARVRALIDHLASCWSDFSLHKSVGN
jgi:DNA-binding transcriptional LysR family regulator